MRPAYQRRRYGTGINNWGVPPDSTGAKAATEGWCRKDKGESISPDDRSRTRGAKIHTSIDGRQDCFFCDRQGIGYTSLTKILLTGHLSCRYHRGDDRVENKGKDQAQEKAGHMGKDVSLCYRCHDALNETVIHDKMKGR
jgi:hypothetical protein